MSGNGRKDKGHSNNSFSGSGRHRVGRASPNSTDDPRYRMSLIPIDMPIVTGVAGSNSQCAISQQTSMADPLADLAKILRRRARETGHMPQLQQTDYRPQLPQTDYRPQSPQMFLRIGGNDGFEDYCFEDADAEVWGSKIHSACIRLFWENLDRPWVQFSDIPNEALIQMFSRFGTKYRWHSQENENIFDAFKCVLKDRYRDRMKGIMRQSANMARNDGKPLPLKFYSYYDGMHNYRPERVPETVWQQKWQKNSKIAQQNRNTADSNGSTARHTAGSIGFDQHRRKLEKLMGKPPTHYDVFMLRAQVSIMEQQQQQMKEQMEMVIRMINMSGNQPRGPPDNPPEDN
ncbi:unnamed protein product [Lactuca virosa]|uniref:Retrotransposon gag domain-containing protein n=1 Tax=Lactuca virosa TaxID=75947 RepID=A0AAU9M4B5_9ASTR|nr:unnamed protein product [Lactuca virosa]